VNFEIHRAALYKTKHCVWVMGILIHISKFWASLSAKRSGILAEVAEGRAVGMFLCTAALLMAL
jgi:hypothetical protein